MGQATDMGEIIWVWVKIKRGPLVLGFVPGFDFFGT